MLSDVARLSKATKSSTVVSSFSWRWVRRLSNSSSISLSLVMLLTESCPNPHFWEQLIFVSVDTSLQATCNQWIDFAILTSCIISEAFLPSSIRGTTYFSRVFLHLYLNALIVPVSIGYNQEVPNFGRNISLIFSELFWSILRWNGPLSRKRMIFPRSSWTLRSRSLTLSSIISVLIQAFLLEK